MRFQNPHCTIHNSLKRLFQYSHLHQLYICVRLDFLCILQPKQPINTLNAEAVMRTQLFSIKAGYEIDLQKCKTMPPVSLIFLILKNSYFHLKTYFKNVHKCKITFISLFFSVLETLPSNKNGLLLIRNGLTVIFAIFKRIF